MSEPIPDEANDKVRRVKAMMERCEDFGRKARERGLTMEILQEILDEYYFETREYDRCHVVIVQQSRNLKRKDV